MQAHFDLRIIVVVDDTKLDKLPQLFDLCNNHPACEDWDHEGDTYCIHLCGPFDANEDLLGKIQDL